MKTTKNDLLSVLSLFTSFSTLICCALPAFLVVLGLGAVVAGVVTDFPFLITLSKNKGWVFGFAFGLMALNFFLVYRKKKDDLSDCFLQGAWYLTHECKAKRAQSKKKAKAKAVATAK